MAILRERLADQDENGVWTEMREICPLNDEGPPVESISEDDCWTIGPMEDRLRLSQFEDDGGDMCRLALGDMWSGNICD